jgi:muramidase (phage lysozyme)
MIVLQGVAPNMVAFLDMVAWSEIGPAMLAMPETDNGYRCMVGSTPRHLLLVPSYITHPRIHNHAQNSDAAGRYQFMGRYWSDYKVRLKLPDFGPESQDRWALQLVKECHATDDVLTGHFAVAVGKCASRWASLPGANYPGQHMNSLASLERAYEAAGGQFA